MTRPHRRTSHAVVVLAAAALVAALTSTGAVGATPRAARAAATSAKGGFPVVQFAPVGTPSAPWAAFVVAGTTPSLSAAGAPRAATDAVGGLQVAYRNPSGDVVWLDGAAVGRSGGVDLTRLLGLAPLLGQPIPAVSPADLDEVFCVTHSGHLLDLTYDPYVRLPGATRSRGASPTQWSHVDLTDFGGPLVTGTPSVVVVGRTTDVFVRTASGHLIEYVNGQKGPRPWLAYDVSVISGGPKVASDPAAFYDPTTKQVDVASTELAPHHGDVVVYAANDVKGRIWNYSNVTAATRTRPVDAGLSAVVYDDKPTLLGATGSTGDLTELVGTDAGTATTWTASDLTLTTPGSPPVVGTPSAAVSGAKLVVTGAAASWGDLFEWQTTGPTTPFTVTDLSATGSGSTRTVAGTPSAVFLDGGLSVFAAGQSIPAPQGTGVYDLPSTKWAQALKDGWPILSVTGGVGARCAPWTQYRSSTAPEPDQAVGKVIAASHLRVTWLSLWTVSGPGTAPAGCAAEAGPITPATYYAHGYAAGRWVAAQIDAYRAAGLALKPDWVMLDPEGYPDNDSGLNLPVAPPSALARSVADWSGMLGGWRAGLDAVDPSLKAGVYVDQYQYNVYQLGNLDVAAFLAGAFAQHTVKGKKVVVAPTRTAYGANIRGFVMSNTFRPTCTQVTNERLILTEAPWNGAYNTVQIPGGSYCPPGDGPPTG